MPSSIPPSLYPRTFFFSHNQQRRPKKVDRKMINGQKKTPDDVGIQIPEKKLSSAVENTTMSGPLMVSTTTKTGYQVGRKTEVVHALLRLLCLFSSAMALGFMVTSEEKANISVYGFKLPVFSKWSFSPSFEYVVGMSAAAAAHSLLQLLLGAVKLVKKAPAAPSRNYVWLVFAGDQIFAYAMMSAGSAASGVTNLNRTGIQHSALPDFCKPLHRFCDRVAVSITFTFFSCFLLAISAVLDVIWLSRN